MTEYLTLEDLLALIGDLGVGPVRDVGLLDAAAHRPSVNVYGYDAYPTLEEKAGALLESIVQNHALVDGNKRLGWLAVVIFYGLNDIVLDAPDDEAFALVIRIATGQMPVEAIAAELARWQAEAGSPDGRVE